MSERTAIIWTDGERYVLRDEEIDGALAIGRYAESPDDAWRYLETFLKLRAARKESHE